MILDKYFPIPGLAGAAESSRKRHGNMDDERTAHPQTSDVLDSAKRLNRLADSEKSYAEFSA